MMHYHTAFCDENGMINASAASTAPVAISNFVNMSRQIFKDWLDIDPMTEYSLTKHVETQDTRIVWIGSDTYRLMFAPCECKVNPFMN